MEQKENPMNGGVGENSYTRNSQHQKEVASSSENMIKEAILDKLYLVGQRSSSKTITVADFGCSVGPNTFFSMKTILEAMEMKYQYCSNLPDFQVFFNDQVSNDFNTLFASLPLNRNYFVAGVPGSFYGRLFPKSSLHLAYSCYSLHWLSELPQELSNKARIHYTNAPQQVIDAYADQFMKDMELFLHCRADEIMSGGMMILITPGMPDGVHHSKFLFGMMFSFLEKTLMDMVKEGSISKDEVDSLNVPMYTPTPEVMREVVSRNGCFTIEGIEIVYPKYNIGCPDWATTVVTVRAVLEGVFVKQFSRQVIDQLFERLLHDKSVEYSSLMSSCSPPLTSQLSMVLKRA